MLMAVNNPNLVKAVMEYQREEGEGNEQFMVILKGIIEKVWKR